MHRFSCYIVAPCPFGTCVTVLSDVQASDATKQLPVFVGHGSADPLVPATLATRTVDGLKASGDGRRSMPRENLHNRLKGWIASDIIGADLVPAAGMRNIEFHMYPGLAHTRPARRSLQT